MFYKLVDQVGPMIPASSDQITHSGEDKPHGIFHHHVKTDECRNEAPSYFARMLANWPTCQGNQTDHQSQQGTTRMGTDDDDQRCREPQNCRAPVYVGEKYT